MLSSAVVGAADTGIASLMRTTIPSSYTQSASSQFNPARIPMPFHDATIASSARPSPPSNNDEHMMGTTIMAVSYATGVVMGADSRTTTGSYIANRASQKIDQLTERIFVCRSGSAADTQAISAIVKYYIDGHRIELGREPLVKTAATLFQELCYSNKDRLMAGMIIGGYDEVNGGQVYALPLGGSLVKQPYALGGSGSTYMYGWIDAEYKVGMSRSECEEFVKKGVAHAMARDGSSGGVIRLVTIDKEGVTAHFVPGDKLPYQAETI